MSYDQVPSNTTLKVKPYSLNFPQQDVDDFYQLIKLSKLAPKTYESLQDDPGIFGVTHEWMTSTKKYWESSYDWRQREKLINSFPHFTADIHDDDTNFDFTIHFAALFSTRKDATPITFLHGWPGSFLEFQGVLSVFRNKYTPDTLPYHIIVPSLPGYTLSSGPPLDQTFKTKDIARIIDKLMTGLFPDQKYIGQGGDIGSFTCRPLSKHPSCKAIHLNFSPCTPPKTIPPSDPRITPIEREGLLQAQEFPSTQSAYAQEHGTRPSTIGFTLSASPVSLLAWIAEKFLTWTDTTPSLDDILDSVTLYWLTQSMPRCIYPYRQFHGKNARTASGEKTNEDAAREYYIDKPLGYSYFPKEIIPMPKVWVETTGKLVFHRVHERGGHFAAMECPDLMVGDVEEFVRVVENLERKDGVARL